MSKSRTKSSRPSNGTKPTLPRPWPIVLSVLLFGCASITLLHLYAGAAAAGSFAALYLFANDGKVSGRMSGDVKMRNGRSRAMAFPSLVRNAYTMAVRSTFSLFSQGFRGLTATQVAAWNAFSYKHSNRFAVSYDVKGKMAYVGLNQNLTNIGQTPISDPPSFVGTLDVVLSTPIVFASAGTVTVTSSAYTAADSYIWYATGSLSAGVSRPASSAFRIIGVDAVITAGVADLSAMYVAKFGNPIAGNKLFVYAVAVDKTTGERGVGSNIIGGVIS